MSYRVVYWNRATADVYEVIRSQMPSGWTLVTLEGESNEGWLAQLRDADFMIVADWPVAEEPGNRIKMLDREHVALLLDVPNGGHIGVWVTAPDGTVVQLAVRPLLPDEAANVAL